MGNDVIQIFLFFYLINKYRYCQDFWVQPLFQFVKNSVHGHKNSVHGHKNSVHGHSLHMSFQTVFRIESVGFAVSTK